jgi:prolyl-tRNA synthetase
MPAKRITKKIENIIREEMDKIEGQEVMFPVVMPKELWEESGRYNSIHEELVRFKDRSNKDMLLGMTHEEAAVHLARSFTSSYAQLPFMIYQIQTKFRDEARPRGGLIRVREFTMKDAYSFHTSQADLEEYYKRAHTAYENIFRRIGLKKFVSVASDSGMMGGAVSHEFMLLADAGEDTIVLCDACGYKANMEVATEMPLEVAAQTKAKPIAEVFTGEAKEIAEICALLKITPEKTIKAVSYNIKGTEKIVLCFIRGDYEVNEAKLKKVVQADVAPSNLKDGETLTAGNIGIFNLNLKDAIIVYDVTLNGTQGMVTGANKADYHIVNVDATRDLKGVNFVDIAKAKEGGRCPVCGKPLTLSGGIEIGNIFQLGTKYTKTMEMTVLDAEGKSFNPIMGCYGIGVGRALASVAEESSDDKGLIFPMSIAPWQVYFCPLRIDDETIKAAAEKVYAELNSAGIEVLYDDRNAAPGYKFADCDLMGVPLRVVISPKSLADNAAEIKARDGSLDIKVSLTELVSALKTAISNALNKLA